MKSWNYFKKRVKDADTLTSATFLRERRNRAIVQNRKYLFVEEREINLLICAQVVTKTPRTLTSRI